MDYVIKHIKYELIYWLLTRILANELLENDKISNLIYKSINKQ